MRRRIFLKLLGPMTLVAAALAGAMAVSGSRLALAHHGWAWADDQVFEISGVIRTARLGNPHGELTVESEGELWTVEVGQPWRHKSAGLDDALLAVGTEVTISGRRAKDPAQKLVKAELVTIAGKTYNLYPDRRS
ncbi:MAG: DUF6152 family protein [Hyphomicrobiales bacterium]